MQFSRVAFALFAAVVVAQTETVTEDLTSTIYSCAPTVTNCPYRSSGTATVVSSASATVTSIPVFANTSIPVIPPSSAPVTVIPPVSPTVITAPVVTPPAPSSLTPVISPSGAITTPASNATIPIATATPTPTNFISGASSVSGSVFVAAAAGLVAMIFA